MMKIEKTDFHNKTALIRVDFNVPLDSDNFEIKDNTRIKAAIPTIQHIINKGGKVVLMSHLGRPKLGPEEKFSLKHITKELENLSKTNVHFIDDSIGEKVKSKIANLNSGEILLLENLRFYKHETAGDKNFAEELSNLGDVYINDAFGTAHRAHASTCIIAQFFEEENRMFGFLMENEIRNVHKAISQGKKPFTAIVGGAKVSSKIGIISELMGKVDNLIIGGAMAYTFSKAKGGNIGMSLVEEDKLGLAIDIIEEAQEKEVNLLLPIDTIIADKFDNNATQKECDILDIPDSWIGMDIGSETIKIFQNAIINSKTILWNGPMGVFEMDNFNKGTRGIAEAVSVATEKGAFSLIGGGDSVAAVNKFKYTDKVSYISTGGGAMLEYLEGKKLPGIEAIEGTFHFY